MQKLDKTKNIYRRKLSHIQKTAIASGLDIILLKQYDKICENRNEAATRTGKIKVIGGAVVAFALGLISISVVNSILSARCLLPSNYLVWEATRPLADCSYCENVTKPIILRNVTRQDFTIYAYSSRPIIVKNAITHWKATKEFSYSMFKRLYEQTDGSYESLEEGCQFLNFKTDMFICQTQERGMNQEKNPGMWDDAEYPATENIFFGYEIGAVMHLDYIPRLMWQGQVKGNKTWSLAPVPECDHICHKFQYYVEPGDIVLLDTRIWYHATSIPKGQFSLTVQSEYG
ncbi:Uncharacterized protein OBRU01_07207 [Operophtera brumata]|uniref:Cupin-like domain-containing protein n=1 Tax=Operophtera brumata TaxID=104452 RepID=A0A0L7LJN2_OPEBR|nr:Uncharacterized protein OBRU01_07207 [Operophtera brumata]